MNTPSLNEKALELYQAGFTVVPLYKVNIFDIRDYKDQKQTLEMVDSISWNKAEGIGIIAGSSYNNDIKVYVFKVKEEYDIEDFITHILGIFCLPESYSWIIRSVENRTFALIVRGNYLFGASIVKGERKDSYVNIYMNGCFPIHISFEVSKDPILFIDNVNVNRLLKSLSLKQGMKVDKDGHYIYLPY